MNILKRIYLLLSVVTLSNVQQGKAQTEFQGSQYLLDKSYINPAFMGLHTKASANLQYQVAGTGEVSGAKNYTVSAAGHFSLPKLRCAIGFNAVKNTFGNDSYSVGYGNYVYHLQVSEDITMSSSLGLGLQQYNINLYDQVTANPLDPLARQNVYSSKLDGRVGLLGTLKKQYYLGLSFDNILSLYTNNNSFSYQVPPTFRKINMYLILGANYETEDNLVIMPSVLYIKNMGGITSLDINTSIMMEKSFVLGVGFRQRVEERNSFMGVDEKSTSQSILRANMSYQLNNVKNNMRIGYCYNFNAAKSGVKVGSHDISLSFSIPNLN